MEIFNSRKDLRVVVRTAWATIIDTPASEIEVEDAIGRFTLRADGDAALAALVPSMIVVRKRDGSEVHLDAGWGSLTAAAGQVRIVVSDCAAQHVEAQHVAALQGWDLRQAG